MAIECVHIYPYKQLYFNRGLDLPLRDYSHSQLAITNIEGLGPVDANINITPFAAKDGGLFNSSRKQQRNITLTMKLFNDPSMESVREKIYSACPVGEPISLVFDYSDGYSKTIDGYVENNPVDYFGENEGIQVSIICPDPALRRVDKGIDRYGQRICYKMVNYPLKQKIVDKGNDIDIRWAETCKDETELYSIDSICNVFSNVDNLTFLFAMSFILDSDELFINFYSKYFEFDTRTVNEYIRPSSDDEYEENIYYRMENDGYHLIESELEFDNLVKMFLNIETYQDFESGMYYKKNNLYETSKWIKVTWDADYSDQTTEKYIYPVKYGFLNKSSNIVDSLNSGFKYILKTGYDIYFKNFYYIYENDNYEIVDSDNPPEDFYTNDFKYYRKTPISGSEVPMSIISMFDSNASYFTSASQMFMDLTTIGEPISEDTEFIPGNFYKKEKTFIVINDHGGYRLLSNDEDLCFFIDPIEDQIYYQGSASDQSPYLYADGHFDSSVPLYTIYRLNKKYVLRGETFDYNKTYYYISDGEEISIHGSKPSDFALVSSKYYTKEYIYEEILDYPTLDGPTAKTINGRYRYNIILDYLGYTYDIVDVDTPYEPNKYYKYIGDLVKDIEGLYGIESIPLYSLLSGSAPSNWGTPSGKYYSRRRRTVSENIYTIYINDHAFYPITDREVYEYEPLLEMPEDFHENFTNYYTLKKDFSYIVGTFSKPEINDYSRIYSLLIDEPDDWDEYYFRYYYIMNNFDKVFKKINEYESYILPYVSDEDLKSSMMFTKYGGNANYSFGDIYGNITYYEFKMPEDVYKPGIYYEYNRNTNEYTLIESSEPPEDFYIETYKYYKKITKKIDYIPSNVVVFYNPFSKEFEYDMDQYELFLSDLETWFSYVYSPILKIYTSENENNKYIRKNNFTTYKLNDSIIQNGLPNILNRGNNYIMMQTVSNGIINYNSPRVIAAVSIL